LTIRRHRLLLAALTGIAFAILVSIAASHLHVGPADPEDGCAVCLAFAGKVEGPSVQLQIPTPRVVILRVAQPAVAAGVLRSFVVTLPPSCGPPSLA
jgi:hypothetical protein